jgi:predicted ATPase
MAIASEHGFQAWLGAGALQFGVAKARIGDHGEALAYLVPTLAAWSAAGAELFNPFFFAGLARAHLAAGDLGAAEQALTEAMRFATKNGELFMEAELIRLSGDLERSRGATQRCLERYRYAISQAEHAGARLLALGSALAWAEAEPNDESLTTLSRITEGFEAVAGEAGTGLPEYVVARALLDGTTSGAAARSDR